MKKVKLPVYRRGDKVVFFSNSGAYCHVSFATVTAVREQPLSSNQSNAIYPDKRTETLVYTVSTSDNGYTWKNKFSDCTMNHLSDRNPLWTLRHLKSRDSVKKLRAEAERIGKMLSDFQKTEQAMVRQVENEASHWKYCEMARRRALIPGGWEETKKEIESRLGFKFPELASKEG